jgi:hypothetical protein
MVTRARLLTGLGLVLALTGAYARIQSQGSSVVTPPEAAFGHAIGDDYVLATYTQLEAYWHTLARESGRVRLVDIGPTEEGRRQWMAVVSAPENLERLDDYRDISRRLALAEGLTEAQARSLARQGKAVVVIAGGLHATEVLGAQQLIELVYRLASRSDEETLRVLKDVIVLVVHANPDGHELVAEWYMRESDPMRRTLSGLPRAYQKYVGHDNNRDFYMSTQAETVNVNRVLYREWFPQIVYDHHQTGPPGTVMFAPPFGGPFNYVLDPLIPTSIDLIGAAIHTRFAAEGKGGVTMRDGSTYSTWWNGGLRTSAYFHNQIGILTETIGSPTPVDIPLIPERQVPGPDLPLPIEPQRWRFRRSVEYSMTANRAVLDAASRYRESLLFGAYRMGKNSIDRGNRDSWTVSLRRVAGSGDGRRSFAERFQDPAHRDARGYILPADQPDFLTATKFVEALLRAGIAVHRATAPFEVGGARYPAGSYVVKTAQAFRPHVLDMFEPQDFPSDASKSGGRPAAPYDIAGWTLAFQMGVGFDRVLEAFEGPFERIDTATPPAGRILGPTSAAGYLLSHRQNDAFVAVNRLLRAGAEVLWPRDRTIGGDASGAGVIYVPNSPLSRRLVHEAAAELGLTFTGAATAPIGDASRLRPVRIGLWDRRGGSSASGWVRWLLERYEFPFDVVHTSDLDNDGLQGRYDVVILPSDAALDPVSRLRRFVEDGGTLVAIGRAAAIGEALGLPVSSGLVDGRGQPLTREQYYVPGSILRVRVDNTTPLGYGFEYEVDVFMDESPVFRLGWDAETRGVSRVAWFASERPLRSGWAVGQQHLRGGVVIVDAPVGRGRVFLFGPEITFRAQSHGTFKFLFNAIYAGGARHTRM